MNHLRVTLRSRRPALRFERLLAEPSGSECRAASARLGFTLIELLVVVALLLILITITVVSVDFGFTSERVRSGARQVQSALEGARDRAIFAREPRGLRLLVDPTEPRMVSSMIYIGAAKNWTTGRIQLERMDFEEDTNGNGRLDGGEDTNGNGRLDGDGIADGPDILIVRGFGCGWLALKDRGYIGVYEDLNFNRQLDPGEDQNGNGILDLDAPRIKIPADENGSWYTVLSHRLAPGSDVLQLVTPYRDPGTTPPNVVNAFQGGGPKTYILELPPRILPDASPILLPDGVVIDLDASAVPVDWRPSRGEDTMIGGVANGLLDGGEDTNSNGRLDVGSYSSHMDIMFSPRGVVTGPQAAIGLLHLYLGERKDVTKVVDIGVYSGGAPVPRLPRYGDVQSLPLVPGQNQFGGDDGEIGQRLLTTIFTQTGKVSTHQVNAVDADGDGYADDPFAFVAQGEGQSQ